MFSRSCSFFLCLFLLCVRNALAPQGNIKKIMTTRGPTVCLAELGEESIQKQLCSFPHNTCSAMITQFFKVSIKILDLLVVAVIKMNNILFCYLFLEITFPFLDWKQNCEYIL